MSSVTLALLCHILFASTAAFVLPPPSRSRVVHRTGSSSSGTTAGSGSRVRSTPRAALGEFGADSDAVAKLQIAMEVAAKREDYAAAAELQQQLKQLRAAQAEAAAQIQPQQEQEQQAQSEEQEEQHPAAAALETFRERQRMRAAGAPVGVWCVSTDPNLQDDETTRTSDERVPLDHAKWQRQKEAVDAVYESQLSSRVPDGFCEGLDAYLDDHDDRERGYRQTITEPGEQPHSA